MDKHHRYFYISLVTKIGLIKLRSGFIHYFIMLSIRDKVFLEPLSFHLRKGTKNLHLFAAYSVQNIWILGYFRPLCVMFLVN